MLKKRKLLVSYLMVGYPDFQTSLDAFRILLEEGTDILEVGFPFSDPVADGPTIQIAHEVALKNNIKSRDVFNLCNILKKDFPHVPFLVMTYYNPIHRIGLEEFCRRAKESGVDGFIVPDLPPEECDPLKEYTQKHGLWLVLLASPTSTEKRLKLICQKTDELTYFVSLTGTTGEREELPLERLKEKLQTYRSLCDKKVVVGFGVSKGSQAKQIAKFSDGVVVGSALVKLVGQKNLEGLREKIQELRKALI